MTGVQTCALPIYSGAVADYIPELAKANPANFGVSVATTDGYIYEVGDSAVPFTIQSISKPFVYGLALEDRGRATVLAKIGVEPTGDAFNSISLAASTGCPLNPMINAGVFALDAKAPHWAGWADLMSEALQRSTDMTDQVALNVLVYEDRKSVV